MEVHDTMRDRIAVGASLAVALLVGCAMAADALKSGPQIGDSMFPFDPYNCTGEYAGEEKCLV
jgi:hypothetical protein